MSGSEEMMGPIDYLIVEWPAGSPPNGEAFPHLLDLVDRGLIRILDFSFVEKDDAGNVVEIDIADFPDLGKRLFRHPKGVEIYDLDAGKTLGPLEGE